MQGRKDFKPQLFYTLSLEKLVPEDHELRRFAAVLRLGWLRKATAHLYSHTGQPSVDPVVLVKMMLLTVLYNVRSERQLAKDMAVNLAYRWFLGYDLDEDTPNHSVLSKARRRFGEGLFVELFSRVVEQCREADLVDGSGLYVDSTLVRADASGKSIVPVEEIARSQWDRLEETVEEEEWQRGKRGPAPKDPSGPEQVGKHFDGRVDMERIGQRRRNRRRSNARRRSRTDPDATTHTRPGSFFGLSYKVHQGISGDGVITAVAVTDSATHDGSQVPRLLEQHREHAGKPERVTGDSHYGSIDVLAYLQQQGIETCIPPFKVKNRPGYFSSEDFKYDRESDEYICPEGARLRRSRQSTPKGRIAYRAAVADCRGCPSRERCISTKRENATRYLSFYAGGHVQRARELCSSPEGQRELKFRHTVLEGKFGTQKCRHGLSRARYRRRWRMSIQAHLTATVMNLKKLAEAPRARVASGTASCSPGQNAVADPASCFAHKVLRFLGLLLRPAPVSVPS